MTPSIHVRPFLIDPQLLQFSLLSINNMLLFLLHVNNNFILMPDIILNTRTTLHSFDKKNYYFFGKQAKKDKNNHRFSLHTNKNYQFEPTQIHLLR